MFLPKERVYLGMTCDFDDVCLLYPPLLGDIAKVTYAKFKGYCNILTVTTEEIQDIYTKQNIEGELPTPFQYLLLLSQLPETEKLVNEAFKFFVHDSIFPLFERAEIIVGDLREKHFINEDNFDYFQNCIRELIGEKPIEKIEENIDPRLARMKAKQRLRDQVKNKQAQKKVSYEFSTLMLSTCCLGVGVTFENIDKLPYATMIKLQELYANKDKFDTDMASIIAGADSKKINLEYWVKD